MSTCGIFSVCRCALETLDRLGESLDLTDFASRIIHPIIRTLDSCPELRTTALDTLCSLVFHLGKQYSTFIPTVNKVHCCTIACARIERCSHSLSSMAGFVRVMEDLESRGIFLISFSSPGKSWILSASRGKQLTIMLMEKNHQESILLGSQKGRFLLRQ